MLRRLQVQTDDVRRFRFEVRIIAGQVAFQAVRFQSGLHQDALHRRLAHPQLARQFTARPVRASIARLLLHAPHHARLHRRRGGARFAAPMSAFQAG